MNPDYEGTFSMMTLRREYGYNFLLGLEASKFGSEFFRPNLLLREFWILSRNFFSDLRPDSSVFALWLFSIECSSILDWL